MFSNKAIWLYKRLFVKQLEMPNKAPTNPPYVTVVGAYRKNI